MTPRLHVMFATFLVFAFGSTVGHAQQAGQRYGELLKRVPSTSNVLLLVDVDGLLDSPIGVRENWRELAKNARAKGLKLDNRVSRLVVAENLDFISMNENWRIGMAEMKGAAPAVKTLADREGGYEEKISGISVAWTPRGFYLVSFPPKTIGFAIPADRQKLKDWIVRVVNRPSESPPAYAASAVNRSASGNQLVLAVDLGDTISARQAEPWLNTVASVRKANLDTKLLAEKLASVKSLSLEVKAGQNLQGMLRVDFDESVQYGAGVLKELINLTLDERGIGFDDLDSWTMELARNEKSVELRGSLSVEAARRLLLLAQPPRLSGSSDSESSTDRPSESRAPKSAVDSAVQASQAYYHSVVDSLDSLKQVKRPTVAAAKIWYEKYAKQIEELPILNVDKDLLDWGGQISRTLRESAFGMNYAEKNLSYTLSTLPNGRFYSGYGTYYAESKGYDQAVLKRQGNAMLSVDLDSRWQTMDISIGDMRRKMTEKYKVEF